MSNKVKSIGKSILDSENLYSKYSVGTMLDIAITSYMIEYTNEFMKIYDSLLEAARNHKKGVISGADHNMYEINVTNFEEDEKHFIDKNTYEATAVLIDNIYTHGKFVALKRTKTDKKGNVEVDFHIRKVPRVTNSISYAKYIKKLSKQELPYMISFITEDGKFGYDSTRGLSKHLFKFQEFQKTVAAIVTNIKNADED